MGASKPGMFLVLGLVLVGVFGGRIGAQTIGDKIRNDPDLSQFLALLERSELANITLQYKQATIFAPINKAFQTHSTTEEDPNTLVLYHMSKSVVFMPTGNRSPD
jgi:hypothetical protein